MKNRIFAIVILVMMLFAMGCEGGNNNGGDGYINEDGDIVNQGNDGYINEDGDNNTNGNAHSNEISDDDYTLYKGKILSNDSERYIEVEIVDSQIAFGKYIVLVDSGTVYQNSEGKSISRDDLKVDDVIEISFSGQVMMSLPPQIYAHKITLK